MRTAIILINGILTDPRDDDAWTDKAESWLDTHIEDPVAIFRYEYNATPLFRRFKQATRARAIKSLVEMYQHNGDRVVLVGHSNGCDLIARVLRDTQVDEVHLISPATDEKELDVGILAGNVGLVFLYGSVNDMALKWGAQASRTLSLGLLGYGSLGLRCAAYEAKHPGIVQDFSNDRYGHRDWLSPDLNLHMTLALIASNAGLTIEDPWA